MSEQGALDPVAVISGTDASGYGIARSLGRSGIPVAALVGKRGEMGRLSRYCRDINQYSSNPAEHPEEICQTLLSWRREFDANPVLFATSDWFALALAQYRRELAEHYSFHWTEPELLRAIIDKARLPNLCHKAGVLSPRTHVTMPGEDIAGSVGDFVFPCIVKPTLNFDPHFGDRKNFVAESPEALLDFYDRCPVSGSSVWQEIIEGGEENIFQCTALKRESGEVVALATVRKLLQYPENGMMCFGRSEENDNVASSAMKFLDSLAYSGLASLEFKFRHRDGRYYFLEMNPRLPWYNGIFSDAGVNLPLLAYEDLIGRRGRNVPKPQQRNGVHWLSAENCVRRWRESGEPWVRTFLWLLTRARRARSFSWWNWRDPLPWLGETWQLSVQLGRKLLIAARMRAKSRAGGRAVRGQP